MEISQRIYNQAVAGTPYNPGVPPALASLLVAQAKHETGDFTSKFFRLYNNAFGYAYYAGSNYQTGAGSIADNGSPIAAYASPENSTMEVVDWLYRRQREGKFPDLRTITTPEVYAVALKKAGYYGDSLQNYLTGLRRFFLPIAAVGGVNLLIVAVVLGYVFRKDIARQFA